MEIEREDEFPPHNMNVGRGKDSLMTIDVITAVDDHDITDDGHNSFIPHFLSTIHRITKNFIFWKSTKLYIEPIS